MPMSFYVTEAEINCVGLTDGDEIGVFDGDLCVGAGILESEIEPPFFSVVASKDDGDGNGFTEGNAISYKFWDYSEGEEIECVSVSYYDNYGEPAVVAVFSGLDDAAVKLAAVSTTPVHFTEWAETAENNLIKINLVELNNRPISEGDEIGIFCPTENGNSQILCGASVWNSSCIIEIIVWEDDTSLTPGEQDGYVCGEEIIIKIWYRCIDQEEQMLVVDEEGDGTFCSGLFGDVNAVNLSGYGPPENTSPIADAGGNQNFHLGNPFDSVLVELDGGNSYDCDGELTDWQWNWDEKTSNELVVSAYFGMGNHRAILRVTDDENAISLDSCEIFITSAPHASFSAGQTEGYAPLTVEFTNTSNLGTGDLISYSWHFGDGETSDEENPTHVFLSADTFYVSLTVSTTNGTDISEYTTITVIEPIQPIATFIAEPDSGYAPLEVVFTNTSNLGTGDLLYYLWRFGDGTISTVENPTHVYENSGEFEARLEISTTHGTHTSEPTMITVLDVIPPTASFAMNPEGGAPPLEVHFTNTSVIGAGELISYLWNFGDAGTSDAENPIFIFDEAGNYDVTLTIETTHGEDISTPKTVIVSNNEEPPNASFSAEPTEGFAPLTVEFTNTSVIGTGDLISYLWNFGDAGTSDAENPSHIYTSVDTFYVSLTVSTTNGTDISEYTTITVIEPIQPIATFIAEPDSGYAPLEVVFTNTSNLGTGELSHYLWRFGDGIISTEANPTHVYEESGEFEARLKIATTHGSDSSFVIIYVLGTVGIEDNLAIPEDYFLRCNYPNPFNATTAVEFGFPEQSQCSIVIYDLSGRKISVLADAEFDPGVYQIRWDGKNSAFQDAPSGIYFYSLHAEKFHKTGKMILLR